MSLVSTVTGFFGIGTQVVPQPQPPPILTEPTPPMPPVIPPKPAISADTEMVQPVVITVIQTKGNNMNMFNLMKAIYELVKIAETLMPNGSGKQKFDHVMAEINEKAGEVAAALPTAETLTKLVNAAVAVLNFFNVFKHKESPAS